MESRAVVNVIPTKQSAATNAGASTHPLTLCVCDENNVAMQSFESTFARIWKRSIKVVTKQNKLTMYGWM